MSEILRWNTVKTRKPHICFGCGNEYPVGALMANATYAQDKSVSSCYWCKTCEEYMNRNFKHGEEIFAGEIYDYDPDGWNKLKAELEEE